MLIVKLQGGLGNQMFQYAFGKALALNNSNIVLFDSSFFHLQKDEIKSSRNLELNLFQIDIPFASRQQIENLIDSTLQKRLLERLGFKKKKYYKENSLAFYEGINRLSGDGYFDGYWQSEEYFKKNIMQIRKELVFREPLNQGSEYIKNEILRNKNSVSIHIRRADYITTPHINAIHGTCTLEYYTRAIALIRKSVANPFFYLFSDDPDWVNKNFANILDNYCLVDHNQGPDSWQDMALMSFCHHHIIANSTFSWWGAWLNPSISKITIAPKKWFANSELNSQTKTLIPQNWIRI